MRWLAAVACLLPLLANHAIADDEEKKPSKFESATKDMTKSEGLWTTYHNDTRILVDIKSGQLGKEYIVIPSIARGISRGMVLGGMSWRQDTGDAIWVFRKVGEKIHIVQPQVRFRAKKGSPEADAVKLAYSDSVIYSLPIITDDHGGHLVDMTSVFLSDDLKIGRSIGSGFNFARDRSTVSKVAAYPKNLEMQVAAVYAGFTPFDEVASPRGVQVRVHYSISELPSTGYSPRVADDRIGYFLTVAKDFSTNAEEEHFVRYINRWNLKKKDPSLDLSPPEEPLVFYIEKTVPVALRPTVKAGILEWNKAFRAIGFDGAIEVRQQRDDDTWDPEDIRYNTFRWITANAGFAMGPSRVNPRTGEILDADIIFDASFLDSWRRRYETFSPEVAASLMPAWPDRKPREEGHLPLDPNELGQLFGQAHGSHTAGHSCRMCSGMQHQFGYGAASFVGAEPKKGDIAGLPKEFVHQGLKEVVMHEVGHTLGLRHNFKASAWKSLDEATKITDPDVPTVASVMDYTPANIVDDEDKQGLYYTQTLGPYDMWAIEYGYSHFTSKSDETKKLEEIASRSGQPGLAYLTDEDTRMTGSDPLSNLFDLGDDPVDYARRQMKSSRDKIDGLVDRTVKSGDGYQKARQAFGLLLGEYFRSSLFATRFVGGVYTSRDHMSEDDKDGSVPYEIVTAEQQRKAMALINEFVFNAPQFDGTMLNKMPTSHWSHWGTRMSSRGDYPIHETIARMQRMVLFELTDPTTLQRLLDNAYKTADGEQAYELPEHFRLIAEGTFGDITAVSKDDGPKELALDSFRRGLQRMTVKELAFLIQQPFAPDDARTLARLNLQRIERAINKTLDRGLELDDLTEAHLIDTQRRIQQVLDAELDVRSIN